MHNTEIEQQVLGALMLDNSAAEMIEPEWFEDPVHQSIMRRIRIRRSRGDQSSPLVLKTDMANDDGLAQLGGANYLARLAGACSPQHLTAFAKELRSMWARREISDVLRAAVDDIENTDVEPIETATTTVSKVDNVVALTSDKPLVRSALAATVDAMKDAVEAYQNDGPAGTPSGLEVLDKMTGGFKAGDMIVMAGRPSMGKTAIALQFAKGCEGTTFFASLEMYDKALIHRLLSMQLYDDGFEIPYQQIINGTLTEEQMGRVAHASRVVRDMPILFGDRDCRSLGKLRAAARRAKRVAESRESRLDLIVVDYLQLIEDSSATSDYQRVSRASNALKSLALELECPVIALSQLNRQVESRNNAIPKMSDLRESGKVEEDADLVMLAYRPDYYATKRMEELKSDHTQEAKDEMEKIVNWRLDEANRNLLRLFIPKARNGQTGAVDLRCDLRFNAVWSPW